MRTKRRKKKKKERKISGKLKETTCVWKATREKECSCKKTRQRQEKKDASEWSRKKKKEGKKEKEERFFSPVTDWSILWCLVITSSYKSSTIWTTTEFIADLFIFFSFLSFLLIPIKHPFVSLFLHLFFFFFFFLFLAQPIADTLNAFPDVSLLRIILFFSVTWLSD